MGKSKEVQALNESQVENEGEGASYEEKLKYVNAIAQPMASKKLAGRVYKLAKKGKQGCPRVPVVVCYVWGGSSRGRGNLYYFTSFLLAFMIGLRVHYALNYSIFVL